MALFDIFKKQKKRGFEGGSRSKRTRNWKANGGDADTTLRPSLSVLRNRSRDLIRNNPYAARGIDGLVDAIVGDGIMGTIKIADDPERAKRLNDQWLEWSQSLQPDFYGQLTFAGLQRQAMRTALEGGEILARRHFKRSGFPLEIQLMEGDHLEFTDNRELDTGGRIAAGIEYDDRGKRIAYHILNEHPGSSGIFARRDKTRVEVSEMSHIYRVDRPAQSRGVPILSNCLIRLRDLDEYEDAQLVRQKIAASWAVFIHDIEGADLDDQDEVELLEKVEPGMIEVLPPGKDVRFGTPPPIEGYKEYMSVSLHAIAAGLGVSYETLTNDLSEVNFSSARMGNLKMQKTVKVYRNLVLKPKFLNFVGREFLRILFLRGENVKGAKFEWTPPQQEMIDPVKETKASIDAIRGGVSTLSEEIRSRGKNPEVVLKEWSEDAKRIDELDLALECDPRTVNRGGSLQDDPDQEPIKPTAKGDEE